MKECYINGEKVTKDTFNSVLEKEMTIVVATMYDYLLDMTYPPVRIGYSEYPVSEVLKKCDPNYYKIGMTEEIHYQLADINIDLDEYREVKVNNITFQIV